jgi:hypothetical protein
MAEDKDHIRRSAEVMSTDMRLLKRDGHLKFMDHLLSHSDSFEDPALYDLMSRNHMAVGNSELARLYGAAANFKREIHKPFVPDPAPAPQPAPAPRQPSPYRATVPPEFQAFQAKHMGKGGAVKGYDVGGVPDGPPLTNISQYAPPTSVPYSQHSAAPAPFTRDYYLQQRMSPTYYNALASGSWGGSGFRKGGRVRFNG